MLLKTLCVLASVGMLGAASMPGPAPTSPETSASGAATDAGVLRGPDLREKVRPTLVRFDLKGNFIRCDGRPELAACEFAGLDSETLAACRREAQRRRAEIGVLLVRNFEIAEAFDELSRKGPREMAAELSGRLQDGFEPIVAGTLGRLPLLAWIAPHLSVEQLAEVDRIASEYWDALVAWELRSRKKVTEADCARTEERLLRSMFQGELRSVHQETIGIYREKLRRMIEEIEPTATQRESIERVVIRYLRDTRMRPTREDRKQVMGEIYRCLDDHRREKLFELVVTDVASGVW